MRIETKCIQEGYKPGNGDPRVMPIYQSTTYKYDSSEHLGKLFDLQVPGHIYSRISNPSCAFVEEKIAALEGGAGAMLTSSGQAAAFIAVFNICGAGEHIVSASSIYGGTYNLFAVTMKRMGIEVTFVDATASEEELQKAFRPNTKAVYGETLANPSLAVLDIEKFARVAHANNVPLIVDNTFATPILCNPLAYGADIVMHSTTKYMDGHASTIGGVIVDGGKFNWDNGKFPELTVPDESYHGVVYTRDFGAQAYLAKARVQLMRDLGTAQSATVAYAINQGIESLHLRMERHSANALTVAKTLEADERISWVNYPGLENNPFYTMAQKYLPKGQSGVISFGVNGGREVARTFMDSLQLATLVVNVADSRTIVIHPATTTHRQMSDEQLIAAGVTPDLIRFSVGIENVEDILEDIMQALEKACR